MILPEPPVALLPIQEMKFTNHLHDFLLFILSSCCRTSMNWIIFFPQICQANVLPNNELLSLSRSVYPTVHLNHTMASGRPSLLLLRKSFLGISYLWRFDTASGCAKDSVRAIKGSRRKAWFSFFLPLSFLSSYNSALLVSIPVLKLWWYELLELRLIQPMIQSIMNHVLIL